MTLLNGWAVLASAVVFVSFRFYLYPILFSPLRHIPRARADWRFQLYEWIYTEPSPIRINSWVASTPHNGLIRYSGIGGVERVIPLSSEAVKEVLVTNAYSIFEKSRLTKERARMLLGNGLTALDDKEHQAHKRKLLPAFAPRRIRPLYSVFWAKACELGRVLEPVVASSSEVLLRRYTSRASLDVIGVAAWGKDFSALEDSGSDSKFGYLHGAFIAKRQARLIYAAAGGRANDNSRPMDPLYFLP
jgi:cytochrome P450